MIELSPLACRVIGALLEKERTVPATYPLTPKAVVSACNQTTGRDPIMSITEPQVVHAIRELREAKFARTVHASHGARTEKYRQVLDEALGLDSAERAVITLLLLRGAQTPGELRSRSDRLHTFGSADEVDASLAALAAREEPLVRQLDRRPGQKEQRWIHLLGSEADRTTQIDRASAATTSVPAIPSTTVPAAPPPPLAPELFPLARFVGIWMGPGDDPDGGSWRETISLVPVDGTASLAYRSTTTSITDGTAQHDESGFLRSLGDGSVELVVAHLSGTAEVSEGLVDDRELILNATTVAGTRTSAAFGSIDRRYVVDGNTLTYELSTSSADPTSARRRTGTLTRQD